MIPHQTIHLKTVIRNKWHPVPLFQAEQDVFLIPSIGYNTGVDKGDNKLKVMDHIHGFTLTSVEQLPDSHSALYRFSHDSTHAELIYNSRDDENKTFAIAFRTPPENDTGVFHILEHSVLNGSGRYPVKEPFVELLKGSMNTFLNALTFDDKTMFPVSSRNDKDFMNLMSVYMDAVFDPEIYRNPRIFMQEGWHYELRDETKEPVYKGVVLNEMKGAYASVDETIVSHIAKALYPDVCYQYSSGGDPAHITDLSYEQFIETHRRFYHPSNARIYLDGKMDLDAVLQFLDETYLSHCKAIDPHTSIPLQTAVPASVDTYEYECSEEDLHNRTMISMARIASIDSDASRNTALSILFDILTGSNDAPLKKPFIDKGLCEDVSLDLYDSIHQPWAAITFRNTEKEKLNELKETLSSTVDGLLKEGLNHDELLAAISHAEFSYRDRQEPAGVLNAEIIMLSWLYDDDPSMYLNLGHVFDELRSAVKDNYFEALLKDIFSDSEHTQTIIAIPSHEAGARRLQAEKDKIASKHPDKADIIKATHDLDVWQNTPDSEENLAKLPHLSLSDVNPDPIPDTHSEDAYQDVPLLVYPAQSSGIAYFNLYFNCAGIRREQLPALAFFTSLLSELPTKSHTVRKLQILMNRYIGSLSISVMSTSRINENDACTPMLSVRMSCLDQNSSEALALVKEILNETVFEKETIRPLLKQTRQSFLEAAAGSGQSFARLRIAAANTASGVFEEYVHGITSGRWLKQLDENYDQQINDFLELCDLLAANLFIASRLTFSYSGDHAKDVHAFIDSLEMGDAHRAKVHYALLPRRNEGFLIPGGVAYAAKGNLYTDTDGSVRVLSHILTYEYLWNEVRVKGGAYGTGISAGGGSLVTGYSYRDPDPANAVKAMDGCSAFMHAMARETDDYTNYIIGAIAAGMPVLGPGARIGISDLRWFSGISYDYRRNMRKQMLETDSTRLQEKADALSKAMQDGMICVIGPKEKLDTLKDYNLHIEPIQ